MKNIKLGFIAVIFLSLLAFSFNKRQTNTIKGTVAPADKAIKAWAVSVADTFNSTIMDGNFLIMDVKPGTYSIIIEAKDPFVNTTKSGVVVSSGTTVTDVGQIQLQQK